MNSCCFRADMRRKMRWQLPRFRRWPWIRHMVASRSRSELRWEKNPGTLWQFSRVKWSFLRYDLHHEEDFSPLFNKILIWVKFLSLNRLPVCSFFSCFVGFRGAHLGKSRQLIRNRRSGYSKSTALTHLTQKPLKFRLWPPLWTPATCFC